ncbi:MAG: hypothetical protein ABIY71_07980, partial [Flavobacteriales bacterium]
MELSTLFRVDLCTLVQLAIWTIVYFGGVDHRSLMRYSRAILPLALSFLLVLVGGSVAAQVVAHAGADATICGGGPVTLGAAAAATGGQGPYQYSWSPSTGLSDPTLAHPICTTTSSQTYTLTVTDANNLTATDAVEVTVLPTAVAAITSSVPFTVFNGISTF